MTVIPGSAGAGSISYKLTLKNRGVACLVGSRPDLQLSKASGQFLPTHVVRVGRSGNVTLTVGTGHSVTARLRFSPDVPGKGEPRRGPCEPAAHEVWVGLFSPPGGLLTGPVKPPTSVCSHGLIHAGPLR